MANVPLTALFQNVADDVAALPVSVVQLVGAAIAMQEDLPQELSSFIMARLALRADMSVVSPAAEAVMRIWAFATCGDAELAKPEIDRQQVFLQAIAQEDKLSVAAEFLSKLADRLEDAVMQCSDSWPSFFHSVNLRE